MKAVLIHRLETTVDGVRESRLVAFEDGQFVGSVGCQHHDRVAAGIRQLFVDPAARRRGIGRKLVLACVHLARCSGCQTLGLSLALNNRGLFEDFYQRLGFIFAYEFSDGEAILVKVLREGDQA